MLVIGVIDKDLRLGIAPGGDVVQGAGVLYA